MSPKDFFMQQSRTTGSKGLGSAPRMAMAFVPALFAATPAAAATLMVGPGQTYALPSQAAAAARAGDTVIITPSTYHDCAVWTADNLTIEASAHGVVLSATVCQNKAIFVIPANNVTVRGVTFTGAKSTDGNGAGIRAEGTNLMVDDSTFTYDQDGILAEPNPASTIIITGSTFIHDGACIGECAHGIYIGAAALLQVDHSRFYATQKGHHIKSRAASTQISDCDIEDGPTGTASYLVDIPNGGELSITDTVLEKGPRAENHSTAISIGEEGVRNSTTQLTIAGNIFTNNGHATVFVTNDTTAAARLSANTLLGNAATPLKGPGTAQ